MTPEDLGYWYLRLNGFLTICNFAVHPEEPGSQRTDVDVLGVRFPHRQELYLAPTPMADDPVLRLPADAPLVAITEIKRGRCLLNGPWTRPPDLNMERVLAAIGIFPVERVAAAALALYQEGCYSSDGYYVALVCLGSEHNNDIAVRYPSVRQIRWAHVLDFVWTRFEGYRDEKQHHPQWDDAGQHLWRLFDHAPDKADFVRSARAVFDLPKP